MRSFLLSLLWLVACRPAATPAGPAVSAAAADAGSPAALDSAAVVAGKRQSPIQTTETVSLLAAFSPDDTQFWTLEQESCALAVTSLADPQRSTPVPVADCARADVLIPLGATVALIKDTRLFLQEARPGGATRSVPLPKGFAPWTLSADGSLVAGRYSSAEGHDEINVFDSLKASVVATKKLPNDVAGHRPRLLLNSTGSALLYLGSNRKAELLDPATLTSMLSIAGAWDVGVFAPKSGQLWLQRCGPGTAPSRVVLASFDASTGKSLTTHHYAGRCPELKPGADETTMVLNDGGEWSELRLSNDSVRLLGSARGMTADGKFRFTSGEEFVLYSDYSTVARRVPLRRTKTVLFDWGQLAGTFDGQALDSIGGVTQRCQVSLTLRPGADGLDGNLHYVTSAPGDGAAPTEFGFDFQGATVQGADRLVGTSGKLNNGTTEPFTASFHWEKQPLQALRLSSPMRFPVCRDVKLTRLY